MFILSNIILMSYTFGCSLVLYRVSEVTDEINLLYFCFALYTYIYQTILFIKYTVCVVWNTSSEVFMGLVLFF